MKKRIVSMFTSMLLVFSLMAYVPDVNAKADSTTEEGKGEITTDSGDVSIEGTNSFGNMLTSSLDEKMDEQEDNNGYNVFSVEMADTTIAAVEFETLEDCTLVVGIYDEAGEAMLASGSTEVISGETDVYVDIETDSMPEYFYLRAFLVDTDCFRPLCTAYESPNYTQEMQEFFAKTTDDFDQDRVLNLDEDKTNNFAVYSEDTTVIPHTEGSNDVVSVDDENNVYVIENADSSITSLQPGETFAYEYVEGEVLIVRVVNISVDGTTATITGEETTLEDSFDYIKIDNVADTSSAQVDDSELSDGVTYDGTVDWDDNSEISTYGFEGNVSTGVAVSFDAAKVGNDSANVKLSGKFEEKIKASVKLYLTLDQKYFELKISSEAKISASVTGKVTGKIPLPTITIAPVPGINLAVKSSLVVEFSAKLEISAKLKSTVGFSVDENGIKDISTQPKLETEMKLSGKFFVGIELEPQINIISDKIAKVGLKCKFGGEASGELTGNVSGKNKIHTCTNCIDGEINVKFSATFEAKLLNMNKLKFERTIAEVTIKITDWYFSIDNNAFGLGECPYKKYKVDITVLDQDADPVEDAKVAIDDGIVCNELITNESGNTNLYLPSGKFKAIFSKDNYNNVNKKFTVDENRTSIKVYLNNSKSEENIANAIFASDYIYHFWEDDDGSIKCSIDRYVGSKSIVNIPQKINGYDVENIMPDSFSGNKTVNKIIVPETVKRIGGSAFSGCSNLAYIELPKTLLTLQDRAFEGCSSLKSITIPRGIDYIPPYLCWNCSSLEEVTIPNGIKTIGDSSFYFTNIKNVFLPDSTEQVGAYAFGLAIEYVSLPDSTEYNSGGWFGLDDSFVNYGHGGKVEFDFRSTQKLAKEVNKTILDNDDYLCESFDSPVTFAAVDTIDRTMYRAYFENVTPNEIYNVYILKSLKSEDIFSSENILYVNQYIVDEYSDVLDIYYTPTENYDEAIAFAVPMSLLDISSAEISVDNLNYTGEEQFINPRVTLDEKVLIEGMDYYLDGDYSATDTGKYTVIITGMGLYTGSIEVSYSVNDVGYDVAGNITSFGSNETDLITITLMTEGNSEPTYCITVGGIGTVKYSIPNVMTGKYTLIISKENHVTRTYKVSVDNKDIVQDLKIHLIGDINGDGKITISDVAKTTSHIRGKVLLKDYDFAVADINGDGKVTISDKAKINAHMRGKSSLWK